MADEGTRGHEGFAPRWKLRAAALTLGVLALLAAAELLLQLHPSVRGSTRRMPVDAGRPIARYEPDRRFTWSHGWNFSIVNTVDVNNAGFVSDVDYEADAPGPLLAVVGASYVAAFDVPYRRSCAGRLATMMEPAARVYSFAMRGATLGQLLVWARYVRDAFRPRGLIVVLNNSIYHYSLIQKIPGFHYFADRGGPRLVLERTDFAPSPARRLAGRSALARYLVYNVDFPRSFSLFLTRLTAGSSYLAPQQLYDAPAGSSASDPRDDPAMTDRQIAFVERVTDAFLEMLPEYSGLRPERILFVADGMRNRLYSVERSAARERLDDSTRRYFERSAARERLDDSTRRYFLAQAARRGHEILDLHPRMRAHWRKHRQWFEWPQETHWNALGHEQCFAAVRSSELLSDAFPRP